MNKEAAKVFLEKLPVSGDVLLGRDKELHVLDGAWADEKIHIVTLVAGGGVGKTALMNEWLDRLRKDNFRGAKRVYCWSFYSQGTSEERQISSDEFIYDALKWWGDKEPHKGSPSDKGKRLARLIREQRTLLILDGLEPLQSPPGRLYGYLKDQAIRALLEELALYQPGLCLVTTRVKIRDIDEAVNESVRRICLEHLTPEVGGELLRALGVKGTDQELTDTAREFKGHALALNLLGRYLAVLHEGDISKKRTIPALPEEEKSGCQARRVMRSFEHFLAGKAELNILYMLGLFDRPADEGAVEALRSESAITGVTAEVIEISDERWQNALKHLRDLNLLAEKEPLHPDTLDCHPLVREYFGERLKEENPEAWKQAHGFLYEYYKNLPGKKYPETLKDMEPLFFAITHGCHAGRHQEALDEVYWDRIRRGSNAYSIKKLGAIGADLAVLSDFFDVVWKKPTGGLNDLRKALVLSWVGSRLRPLGRLREAVQVMKASLKAFVKQKNWKEAAINASNLSEIHLILGDVKRAMASARQGVEFSDRSRNAFQQVARRADLADALHQAGRFTEAEQLFMEVEEMQKQRQPDYPLLYSLQGFQYCDFLLGQGKHEQVLDRVAKTLEWVTQAGWLQDIALDELSMGRAHFIKVQMEGSDDYSQALEYYDLAVAGLNRASAQHHLPRGLLARAALYREQKEFDKARRDLDEVKEIAEHGSMKLFLTDYYLETTRLFLYEGQEKEARKSFGTAQKMVEKMEYCRRGDEVKDLEKMLDTAIAS